VPQDSGQEPGGFLQQPAIDAGRLSEAIVVSERFFQLDYFVRSRALEVVHALGDLAVEFAADGSGLFLTEASVSDAEPVGFADSPHKWSFFEIAVRNTARGYQVTASSSAAGNGMPPPLSRAIFTVALGIPLSKEKSKTVVLAKVYRGEAHILTSV
ncbi:uncharacterized protein METZ01_LOCUS12865, partial [marine metagenome]